jgi:nitroreductase
MTNLIPAHAVVPVPHDGIEEELAALGGRLRIISHIEPGFGVVPVFGTGAVLLQPGEVAVYKEERPYELVPGLYCLERQRPVASSPLPDSPREISREVVYARPYSGPGKVAAENSWEYVALDTRVVSGIRRYARPEGPIYSWALNTLLLGPVVGIYAPAVFAGEC